MDVMSKPQSSTNPETGEERVNAGYEESGTVRRLRRATGGAADRRVLV